MSTIASIALISVGFAVLENMEVKFATSENFLSVIVDFNLILNESSASKVNGLGSSTVACSNRPEFATKTIIILDSVTAIKSICLTTEFERVGY